MIGDLARIVLLSIFSFSLPSYSGNSKHEKPNETCELVGTFSLLTQALLGLLCLLSLIVKRFYEHPIRRTWKVWIYDVSKQVIGALGVHVFNLLLSILKSSPTLTQNESPSCDDGNECLGDPCDWYFLSIVLDCTIGVYILSLVLKGTEHVAKYYFKITQIESGEYGRDPHHPSFRAFLKQLALYFGSLMITKFLLYGFVECFESQLIWITSHLLLSWLDEYPNELEIFIVMFLVPIVLNSLQLILVDNIIQDHTVHEINSKAQIEGPREPLCEAEVDALMHMNHGVSPKLYYMSPDE